MDMIKTQVCDNTFVEKRKIRRSNSLSGTLMDKR